MPIDPEVEITLVLRPRADTAGPSPEDLGRRPIPSRRHLDRASLAQVRGADPDDVAAVSSWAQRSGLAVVRTVPGQRVVLLSGALSRIAGIFKAEVELDAGSSPPRRRLVSQPVLPEELSAVAVAVLGLDSGPFAPPRLRRLPLPDPSVPLQLAAPLSFDPPQVASLYRYPNSASASGRCIALLELGGGYQQADLGRYFGSLGIKPPTVTAVSVQGAVNAPTGDPNGPDGEVTLDIEVAGSIAPAARLAVYVAPNTDQGFLAAVQAAIHDQVNSPCVLSISWGGPEAGWPQGTIAAFEQAFQDAAMVGMTVCVAAGDNGSSDGLTDGLAHVDYPAASPYVLACGGTRLEAAATRIVSQVAWNDQPQDGATGGGVSAVFPLPTWQQGAKVPASVNPGRFRGRGLPDLAGDADPVTGYRILVDQQAAVFGGTSAVAPLLAALVAICSGALGRNLGYLNPLLYQVLAADGVTSDVVQGTNGAYSAGVGWDPCSGWGSPIGELLLERLRTSAPAPRSSAAPTSARGVRQE
ncbi:MAG: S53 family peptidase [Candidatus Dormibacteria bacterium]